MFFYGFVNFRFLGNRKDSAEDIIHLIRNNGKRFFFSKKSDGKITLLSCRVYKLHNNVPAKTRLGRLIEKNKLILNGNNHFE